MGTTLQRAWKRASQFPAITIGVVGLAYFVVGWLAQFLVTKELYICALWPSAGIGLAAAIGLGKAAGTGGTDAERGGLGLVAAIRLGKEAYVGIALGSILASLCFFGTRLSVAEALVLAVVTAVGPVLEAILARWRWAHTIGPDMLLAPFNLQLRFVFAIIGACLVSALVGVLTAFWFRQIVADEFVPGLLMWWSGDVLGILLFTPLLLSLGEAGSADPPTPRWQRIGYMVFVVVATLAVFFFTRLPFTPVLLLVVLYGCFFLPPAGALSSATFISLVATWATTRNFGPLAGPLDFFERALNLHLFCATAALTALFVTAGVRRREKREQILNDLFDDSPVGIGWSEEHSRRFEKVNKVLAKELGYDSPGDMLRSIEDVARDFYWDAADRKALLESLREDRRQRTGKELRFRSKAGDLVWLYVIARRVIKPGESARILGYARDVTDHVRTTRLRCLTSKIAERLAILDDKDRLEECYLELHQDLEAEETSVWLVSEDGQSLRRNWRQPGDPGTTPPVVPLASNHYSYVNEMALQKERELSSEPEKLALQAFALSVGPDSFGAIVVRNAGWLVKREEDWEYVQSTAVQMIAAVLAWALLQQQKKLLERQTKRFHTIAEQAQVGIFEADSNGTTIYVNRAGKVIEGLREGEPVANWHEHLAPEIREGVLRAWKAFLARCQQTGGDDSYSHRQEFVTPEGNRRMTYTSATAVRDQSGRLTGFVGVFPDMTEIEQERMKLEEERLRLRLTIGSVRHDTKNSVYMIKDVFRQLRSRLELAAGIRELIDIGEWNLQALLDFAKEVRTERDPESLAVPFSLHLLMKQFTLVSMFPDDSSRKSVLCNDIPAGLPYRSEIRLCAKSIV